MGWKAHGEWWISVREQLFIYRVRGAWNEEAMIAFSAAAREAAEAIASQPWAILGDLREWQLATLDCQPYMARLGEQAIRFNCVLQCLMPGAGPIKRDLLEQAVPNARECERHFVEDLEAGLELLRERGFRRGADLIAAQGLEALLANDSDATGVSAG